MRNGIPISPIVSISHRSWQVTNYYKLYWYAAEKICRPHLSLRVWSHFLPQWAVSAIFLWVIFSRCKHSQLVLMHLIIYTYHTRDMENDSVTLTSYIFLHSINSIKRIRGYVTPCAINFKVQAWIFCICAQKLWQYEGHSGMTILWDLGWACKPFLGKGPFIETSVDLWFHNVIWLANNKQDKVVWVIIADLGQ